MAQLNRDTEHANAGSISPIFNKEKEQNRLKQAQLIGEIGGQAMDVIRTQGDIAGLKAQKDPAALAQAREQLEKSGKPTNDAAVMQRAYDNAMRQYGTGSDLQKAAQAVTGALTALAGNNLAGALASGASPYLATEIKKRVGEDNMAANAMAHAVLGAVTAQLNNQSAAAGGLGAGGGELAARYIAGQLFPGKTAQQLSESEKQQVSALSQLAAGLAGGLATGDTAGAVTGGQAGKNAVENNYLSSKQIDAWSAEMKSCQAGGGDCTGIIKKYEELSTAQQQQLISDCASSPTTCQKKYGEVLADSLAVKQAIDRALGEDIPIKVVYDLTATWAHQMDADGVIASNKVSEQIMAKYGLDQAQADIIAGVALSALGGVSKAGKGSAIPVPEPVKTSNGFVYQSNSKHTLGGVGNRPNAGIEPKNSLFLFENSVPLTIKGKEHKARYTIDSNGDIHRFSPDNTGGFHWSGSTADPKNKLELPNDVRAALRKQEGWKIK